MTQDLVCGLDVSLTHIGLIAVSYQTGQVVHENEIISSRVSQMKPVGKIVRDIMVGDIFDCLINSNIDTYIMVGIEDYAYAAVGQRILQTAEFVGAIKYALSGIGGLKILMVPQTTARKFTLGKGILPKTMIPLMVYKRWGVEWDSDHLVDAFIVAQTTRAITHWRQFGNLDGMDLSSYNTTLTKPQLEAIKNYLKRHDQIEE